jgi:signal peptidase I
MQRSTLGSNIKATVIRLSLLLVVAWVIRSCFVRPVTIEGVSMQPTCREGQIALVNKLAYRFGPPQRGDLVCFWTGKELYAKRIIGLPGEEIALRDGLLYVNGQPCPEHYLRAKGHWTVDAGTLGANRYAVAGDNRSLAQHRAVLVVVRRERIVGKLVVF